MTDREEWDWLVSLGWDPTIGSPDNPDSWPNGGQPPAFLPPDTSAYDAAVAASMAAVQARTDASALTPTPWFATEGGEPPPPDADPQDWYWTAVEEMGGGDIRPLYVPPPGPELETAAAAPAPSSAPVSTGKLVAGAIAAYVAWKYLL